MKAYKGADKSLKCRDFQSERYTKKGARMTKEDYLRAAFTNKGNRRYKDSLRPFVVVFMVLLVIAIIGQVVR